MMVIVDLLDVVFTKNFGNEELEEFFDNIIEGVKKIYKMESPNTRKTANEIHFSWPQTKVSFTLDCDYNLIVHGEKKNNITYNSLVEQKDFIKAIMSALSL